LVSEEKTFYKTININNINNIFIQIEKERNEMISEENSPSIVVSDSEGFVIDELVSIRFFLEKS
jgi:phosphatidylglycerophosphatase A